jgi:hypothetical protein
MMTDPLNYDPLYVELRMREMRAAAEQARLVRQARGPRRLRRRVGALLIRAGEALAYGPLATAGPEGATTRG